MIPKKKSSKSEMNKSNNEECKEISSDDSFISIGNEFQNQK